MFAVRKKIALLVLGLLLLKPVVAPSALYAQNTGEPFFQRVGLYTLGGGGIGALAGAAVWLTDPAGKDSNLGKSMLLGMAVGVIAGTVFGIYKTSNQVVPESSAWEERLKQLHFSSSKVFRPEAWQAAFYQKDF